MSIPSPSADWRVLFSFDLGQAVQNLGLTWFPDIVLSVHAYAICIMIGILAAALLTHHRLTARGAEPGIVLDVALWSVLLGIVGARIYHVLTHPDDYFFEGADPWAVIRIWDGGIAIFGALIGGAIGTWIGCRLVGLRFWSFADALAPGLLLAQAFGRLGNWFNQELYGLPTDLPWGLEIDSPNPALPIGLPEGTLFHPTFLYEIVWNVAGVIVILAADRHFRLQWGRALGLYLVWYGVGRSVFESIRIDPSEIILGLRVNVWASIVAVLVGLAIIYLQHRRHPGLEPSVYLPGKEWAQSTGVDSEGTYSDTDDDGSDAAEDTGSAPQQVSATSGAGAK
ncbi:prolipoprotein diacylglyceryl transferase [Marisediminicola senii]|uniref:prolipoprotein diacylglyceryl transferase n=1 Tax=Marisediminicola senii TaxID=2711233 RepID=UPI0013EA9021|nr:prolipoprotein diacylglyceryl transferase [Marisediminicola senii]